MGSTLPDRALGMLKNEMLRMGSLIIRTAYRHAVPAGSALAVSREEFAEEVTATHRRPSRIIECIGKKLTAIPDGPTIIATGPLTSKALTAQIQALTGQQYLYFYDAMAPIVTADSIDMTIAFRQSRYDRNSDGRPRGGRLHQLPAQPGGVRSLCPGRAGRAQDRTAGRRQGVGALLRGLHAHRGAGRARP